MRSWWLALVAAALGVSPLAAAPSDYAFFLDGRRFDPGGITIAGEPGRLAPGDAISVGGLFLTLGPPGEYRFRSAPEGVRLEEPDGRLRWVGVRVGHTHVGERYAFVDGLAGLTRDEVRGLWGLEAVKWTKSCVEKAPSLDVSRVFVTLGQTASASSDDLPALPRGLRFLDANRFVGWNALARLDRLEYLSVTPEKALDARLLARMQRLRLLTLYFGTGRLRNAQALGALHALERFDARYGPVTDIAFARSFVHLREIEVPEGVRDLRPLSGLAKLERIAASGSRVAILPDGPLPALRTLDIVATDVPDEAVAAFRRANPAVRIRHRWNPSLREALADSVRVRAVKQVFCSAEEPASAGLDTTDPVVIAGLVARLEIDEDDDVLRICGCLGEPTLEFHRADGSVELVTMTCGSMLAWEGWPAHGQLVDVRGLVEWLDAHGVPGPLAEYRETQQNLAEWRARNERALGGLSPELRKEFERVEHDAVQPEESLRPLIARLRADWPVRAERIRVLFRILGAHDEAWSGYDMLESSALTLLGREPRGALEPACAAALHGADPDVRRGAARFCDTTERLPGWPTASQVPLRQALLDVMQGSASAEVRADALERLEDWWATLPADEREGRLAAGLADADDAVRRRAGDVATRVRRRLDSSRDESSRRTRSAA